jgi:hypothetical protein
MAIRFSYADLPFHLLRCTDTWNLHPFLDTATDEDSSLLSSIRSVGILCPPLVLATHTGRYEVLAGRRRIQAYLHLGQENSICCRVVPEETSYDRLLVLILEDALKEQSLSPIENAYFFHICLRFLESEDVVELFCRRLSLPEKNCTLTRLLRLLSLEPVLQRGLHSGMLAENIAQDFVNLSSSDRLAIFDVFSDLQLGGNKQKRLFVLLRDSARQSGCTLETLMKSKGIQYILQHEEMNIPQKGHNLIQHLQQLNTPELYRQEALFARWQAGLELSSECNVWHSQSFEKDEVSLALSFTNRKKLEDFWEQVKGFFHSI